MTKGAGMTKKKYEGRSAKDEMDSRLRGNDKGRGNDSVRGNDKGRVERGNDRCEY
jgi:hypothetical protein